MPFHPNPLEPLPIGQYLRGFEYHTSHFFLPSQIIENLEDKTGAMNFEFIILFSKDEERSVLDIYRRKLPFREILKASIE